MKPSLNYCILLLSLFFCFTSADISAQISKGGIPYSYSRALLPDTGNVVMISAPPMDVISSEDQKSSLPYRFAVNLPVDLGFGNAGTMVTTAEGTTVWRLSLKSAGAKALILYFDLFHIPEGGKLFVYNTRRTQLLGAFTALNNNNLSTFATGLIYGDALTLEYNSPEGLPFPELHIAEVGYAYRGISELTGNNTDFGGSGKCEVNVNCDEGNGWEKQIRSVARIAVKRGGASLWCTGSLIDNTRHNAIPYVLTADHCGKNATVADFSQWIFYFNYEGAGCADPSVEPPINSVTGASMVAHGGDAGNTGSDFLLVKLKSAIPDSYNVYFNGWNRETVPPSPSGTCIHHPQGDIKKISTYTAPVIQTHWVGNPALAHWRVIWSETRNGHGTTEGGSSGSPLYDNQGFLIGTLTGGDSSCDSASLNLPDYYGMFSYHWDKNGTDSVSILKCWLDPDNTGLMSLKGWSLSTEENLINNEMVAYPNPVTDQLKVKFSTPEGTLLKITFHDIWGNPHRQFDRNAGDTGEIQVDMSDFTPGIYLMGIQNGDRLTRHKIIKL